MLCRIFFVNYYYVLFWIFQEEMEGVQGVAPERTIDDLLMYDRIFVELSEFDVSVIV